MMGFSKMKRNSSSSSFEFGVELRWDDGKAFSEEN